MFVIRIKIKYRWDETYIIPKPSLYDAMQYAFECAKTRCMCSGFPETYEEFIWKCNDDSSGYSIDVLSQSAQLMI